jgi:ribosomal protein S13
MEQVLDIYEQPYDPKRPVICFDERPCQLLGDVMVPMPMKPGRPERQDYHYERNGTCCVLMAIEPKGARRVAKVTERKTKQDYAKFMKELADKHYPRAEKIVLVQDNLNTHTPASFYEAFQAEEAFQLTQRFQMIFTPKKASWLNMAEIELSALSKQCLDRRIADQITLAKQVKPWAEDRNQRRVTINWQFTKNNARDKFQRFYDVNN